MCETPRAQNPQIGRERPGIFGFQPPKKSSGSLPPDVGLRGARFFGKCETASLLADRISVLGEVGFTQNFTLATSPHPAGVTACVRPRERALSNKPCAAPHTPCPTRSHN